MKKVLFVVPPQSKDYPEYPHTGIGYLSEYLEVNGGESAIIDMRLGYPIKEVLKKAKEYNPDLIAITLVTAGRNDGYAAINELKKAGYNVVIGGPHVSMLRKKVLEECGADFAVKGEGEEPLLELVQEKPLEEIKNLIYRKDGEIIENIDRPFISELDKVPWPKHSKIDFPKYKGGWISIVSSRGCPYQCVYCSARLGMGMKYRARSPENVLEELKYWNDKGVKYFHIVDDNFTLDKSRVMELCDLILKNNIQATFACDGVRADRVDFEVMKKMREAGFKYLSFGVEGGNNKVLARIKKGETIEQIEKAIKDACDLGFEIYLFFIVGSPGETPEDVDDSINLALKYPIAGANFYNLVPFPGTELFDYALENNYFIVDPKEYLKAVPYYGDDPVFETPEFSREERIKALKKTRKVRQQIRRRVLKKRLDKLGVTGKLAYPFLRNEFIKDVIVGRFLVKIPFVRGIVRKKTEQAFV